jgi:hypothetical protein
MQVNLNKNILSSFLYRIIFFCLLVFASIHADGQTDTTVSIVDDQFPPPQDEENIDDETDHKINHFLNKSDYERLEIQQRNIPDTVIKRLKEEKAFWYADKDFNKKIKEKKQENNKRYVPLSEQTWFQTLLWLLIIGGFAAAVIWYLADNRVGLFRKKNKKAKEDDERVMPENIFAINYQLEIDKATTQNNYRLVVRLMFLRLLKNLSERNIILYKQDKTNFDYLMQLQPTAFYKDFFRITRNYEYSWYGKFEVSVEAYSIIKGEFDHFENRLNKA